MTRKPQRSARIIQLNQNLQIANSIEELLKTFLEINEELERHLKEEEERDSGNSGSRSE